MSLHAVNHSAENVGGNENDSSFADMPKGQYSLDGTDDVGDGMDDDIVLGAVYPNGEPARRDEGFTKKDQNDMYRMGKTQELRVCVFRM